MSAQSVFMWSIVPLIFFPPSLPDFFFLFAHSECCASDLIFFFGTVGVYGKRCGSDFPRDWKDFLKSQYTVTLLGKCARALEMTFFLYFFLYFLQETIRPRHRTA
jgi:hypothetical protein